MLTKKYVKSRNLYKVNFELPLDELPEGLEVHSVQLAGEFNDWDESATPLTFSTKKKAYWTTVDLPPATTYQFRYLLNGDTWYNDWAADGYAPGEFGEDNCIVTTPEAG
jgi:hypothetical protein